MFLFNERGSALVEYSLIVALMAVVIIGIITQLGDELEGVFSTIKDAISTSSPYSTFGH